MIRQLGEDGEREVIHSLINKFIRRFGNMSYSRTSQAVHEKGVVVSLDGYPPRPQDAFIESPRGVPSARIFGPEPETSARMRRSNSSRSAASDDVS
jgi:hypothetical protein